MPPLDKKIRKKLSKAGIKHPHITIKHRQTLINAINDQLKENGKYHFQKSIQAMLKFIDFDEIKNKVPEFKNNDNITSENLKEIFSWIKSKTREFRYYHECVEDLLDNSLELPIQKPGNAYAIYVREEYEATRKKMNLGTSSMVEVSKVMAKDFKKIFQENPRNEYQLKYEAELELYNNLIENLVPEYMDPDNVIKNLREEKKKDKGAERRKKDQERRAKIAEKEGRTYIPMEERIAASKDEKEKKKAEAKLNALNRMTPVGLGATRVVLFIVMYLISKGIKPICKFLKPSSQTKDSA